jgi:hypothetical protein
VFFVVVFWQEPGYTGVIWFLYKVGSPADIPIDIRRWIIQIPVSWAAISAIIPIAAKQCGQPRYTQIFIGQSFFRVPPP